MSAFGARDPSKIRVVSFNILAVAYARTQLATQIMWRPAWASILCARYPYCPSQILDYAYRQPLIGRELHRLDGDIVLLQDTRVDLARD